MAKAEASTATTEEKMTINRREFLNLAWLASLGFLTVNLGGVTLLFSMPRFREGEFGGLFTLGPASTLPEPNSGPANFPGIKTWISRTDEGVLAIYKVCTHLGCLYGWSDQEGKFICPCHGSQFQLDGTFIQGPAPRSLDRFEMPLVDPATEEVLAESTDGKPLPVPADSAAIIRVDTGRRINGDPHG